MEAVQRIFNASRAMNHATGRSNNLKGGGGGGGGSGKKGSGDHLLGTICIGRGEGGSRPPGHTPPPLIFPWC